jgi:hypothetical protein
MVWLPYPSLDPAAPGTTKPREISPLSRMPVRRQSGYLIEEFDQRLVATHARAFDRVMSRRRLRASRKEEGLTFCRPSRRRGHLDGSEQFRRAQWLPTQQASATGQAIIWNTPPPHPKPSIYHSCLALPCQQGTRRASAERKAGFPSGLADDRSDPENSLVSTKQQVSTRGHIFTALLFATSTLHFGGFTALSGRVFNLGVASPLSP